MIILIDKECPKCDKICWIKEHYDYDGIPHYKEVMYCWNCGNSFVIYEEDSYKFEDSEYDLAEYADKTYSTAQEALNGH